MSRPNAYQVRKQFADTPHIRAVARALDCHPRYVHEVISRGTYADPPCDPLVVAWWDTLRDTTRVVERLGYDRQYITRVLRKSSVARRMRDLRDTGLETPDIAAQLLCPIEDVRAIDLRRPKSIERVEVPPPRKYVSDSDIRRQYGRTPDADAVAVTLRVEVDRVRKVVPCP